MGSSPVAVTPVSNEHPNTTTVPDSITTALEQKQYWKQDIQIKRKQINLENMIKTLSLPVKTSVIQKAAKNHPKSMEAILAQNNSETKFESMVSTTLINHLKQLNKDHKFPLLHETLKNIFGEQLNDESFTKWLSCKLQIRHSKFNEYHSKWRRSLFSEIRGSQELSQNVKQNIYDT